MTTLQFRSILRLQLRLSAAAIAIGLFNTVAHLAIMHTANSGYHREAEYTLADLHSNLFGMTDFYIALACVMMFPPLRAIGGGQQYATLMQSQEFFFTRAISRRGLFFTKAALYLLVAIIPSLMLLNSTRHGREVRLDSFLPEPEKAEAFQFYLAHYEGSHEEKIVEDGRTKSDQLILPDGRFQVAVADVLKLGFQTLLFQAVLFALWRSPYGYIITISGSILATALTFVYLSSDRIRFIFSEIPTAWLHNHVLLTCSIWVVLAAGVQWFACRRFVATEVTA